MRQLDRDMKRDFGATRLLRLAPFALFAGYLLVGLFLCDDYGVSWDEQINRRFGHHSLDHAEWMLGIGAAGGSEAAARSRAVSTDHGPFFELVLAGLERALRIEDTRDVLLMRHRASFVAFWCGAVAFFLLLRRVLRDDLLALLGSALLISTPRLFAHSFFNSKDTVLLALFVISSLTMWRFLERRTGRLALWHALACAVTIDVRLVGLLLPGLTLLLLGLRVLEKGVPRSAQREALAVSAVYLVALAAFVVLFWPQLWGSPVAGLFEAISRLGAAQQLDNDFTRFAGDFVPVDALPWYYLPTWMAITTPPLVGILFLLGLCLSLAAIRRAPLDPENRGRLLFLLLFFLPLAAVLTLRPILYDGWRHFYFVYPAVLAIAMLGVERLCSLPRARGVALCVVGLAIAHSIFFVVRDHPYQHVYFNLLAGTDTESDFELDYWGLSFREGLETILELEPTGTVAVALSDVPGVLNRMILEKHERERIRIVRAGEARYFVSNHRSPDHFERFRSRRPPYGHEIHSIRVGGARILGIYRPEQ